MLEDIRSSEDTCLALANVLAFSCERTRVNYERTTMVAAFGSCNGGLGGTPIDP